MLIHQSMLLNRILSIKAGGPGSGCRGPNCGRPSIGRSKSSDTPHSIGEGDIVRFKNPVTVYNMKTGNNDKVAGAKGKVVNVLPRIGTNDQMLSVTIIAPTKHHENDSIIEHVKMNDVELHTPRTDDLPMFTKPWFKPTKEKGQGSTYKEWQKQDIQPVPKSKVIAKFKTSDGADVTWVRPHGEHEENPVDITKEESRYKGKFDLLDKVSGADNNVTRIYDSSKIPAEGWKREGGSAAAKPGATVWVHRYPDKVVIQEQPYTRWSTKTRGLMTFTYKNVGKAFAMLKSRYGISMKLKKERF